MSALEWKRRLEWSSPEPVWRGKSGTKSVWIEKSRKGSTWVLQGRKGKKTTIYEVHGSLSAAKARAESW